MKYQVDEPGGTTRDGQSYGGRSFKVALRTRHCTCERPSKYHWPCSHTMSAARIRNVDISDGVVVRLPGTSPRNVVVYAGNAKVPGVSTLRPPLVWRNFVGFS